MIPPVRDPRVWASVRGLYVGAAALFLANITLGIANALVDDISRGQILSHFHAGSIGWVTLGVIATALWVYTGERNVSVGYARFTALLTGLGIASVAGYVGAFFLGFNEGVTWLLPVFGIPTWLLILATLVFLLKELSRQVVVTTVHLLLLGAVTVASLGATMGVLWGLALSTGASPYPSGADPIGAHAGPMDMYLALAFAAIVELVLRRDDEARWRWPGMTQMLLGVVAAFIVAAGLFFGVLEVAPIALLLFIGTFLFYFGRIGWRTFATNPFKAGRDPAVFWGGLAFPGYIALFVTLVFVYFIPEEPLPHWLGVTFVHVTFVGMATNLLLAAQSAYTSPPRPPSGLESIGVWTLNVGLVAFIAGEYFADVKHGAYLMALGVLVALYAVVARLMRARPRPVQRR